MAFSYSPKIITDGLVLYLDAANPYSYVSGSTAWNDISRGGNNGTLVNGPTFSSANNGSIVFDGVDDYTNIGNPSILNISNAITLESWIYITAFSGGAGVMGLLSRWGSVTGRSYKLAVFTASKKFYIDVSNIGTDDIYFTSDTVLNLNQWYQVVGVYNGSSLATYINGSSTTGVLTGTVPSSLYTGSSQVGVGWDGSNYFTGRISTSRIYNRALSAQEVQQNYNATKGRFGLT